jgi:hypothetical protein
MGDAAHDKEAYGDQDRSEYHGRPKQSIPARPAQQAAARIQEFNPPHQKLPEKTEHCSKGAKKETKGKGFTKTTVESSGSEKGSWRE